MKLKVIILQFALIAFSILITSTSASSETTNSTNQNSDEMAQTFLYFAYGSNMLAKRIHINNPTAVQKYIGILKDYRLDFNLQSNLWKGAASTIVPSQGSEVWGVIWEIDMNNLPNLDHQEGVENKIYFAKNVNINTTEGKNLNCRVYQQCQLPDKYVSPDQLPPERQPSFVYLNTMITGAKECNIPKDYINYLESFRHNGYNDKVDVPI